MLKKIFVLTVSFLSEFQLGYRFSECLCYFMVLNAIELQNCMKIYEIICNSEPEFASKLVCFPTCT